MTVKRFVVESGTHNVGDAVGWKYDASTKGIKFYNDSIPDRVINLIGNYIGEEVGFICNGELSRFIGKVK